MLWPVLLRSTARQLVRGDSWAKAARESLGEGEPAVAGSAVPGGAQPPVARQTQSIAKG
jgi:hypothetical protein